MVRIVMATKDYVSLVISGFSKRRTRGRNYFANANLAFARIASCDRVLLIMMLAR